MGLDQRIGRKFLHPGPGYGGSCFPKDTRAIMWIAEEKGVHLRIVGATIEVNDERPARMMEKIRAAFGGIAAREDRRPARPDVQAEHGRPAGVARRWPSSTPCSAEGATVRAYDPVGMPIARETRPSRRRLLRERARGPRRGGRPRRRDRVEPVPRHRRRRPQEPAARATSCATSATCTSPEVMRAKGFDYVAVGR